jgi:hypothetical protein
MGDHVERMEEIRNEYKIVIRKSERKRTLGISRLRWEENIMGWELWLRIGTSGGLL